MSIEITLHLDETKVKAAVEAAWAREFAPADGYHDSKAGAGWAEVVAQVRAHIQAMDLSAVIARVARDRIDHVVDEVMTGLLRSKAKEKAKEMMRDGSLLKEAEA